MISGRGTEKLLYMGFLGFVILAACNQAYHASLIIPFYVPLEFGFYAIFHVILEYVLEPVRPGSDAELLISRT